MPDAAPAMPPFGPPSESGHWSSLLTGDGSGSLAPSAGQLGPDSAAPLRYSPEIPAPQSLARESGQSGSLPPSDVVDRIYTGQWRVGVALAAPRSAGHPSPNSDTPSCD